MKTLVLLATAVCLVSPRATSAANAPGETTVAAYLNTQPKPVFREGHTLPPLTRYAWSLGFDTRVALARDWGYALEYGGYATIGSVARDLADPKSDNARVVELAAREPKKFPLAVICARDLPYQTAAPEAFTRSAKGNFLNGKSQSPDGTVWNESTLVWSPAAPEAVWREAGRLRAEPLRTLRAKAPIAIVLNGGEYGINVTGFAKQPWSQDPRVL